MATARVTSRPSVSRPNAGGSFALSPDEIQRRLTERYGTSPFDGNNAMSFGEWLDRHPALQRAAENSSGGVNSADARARNAYEEAVNTADGGQRFQQANPDFRTRKYEPTANMLDKVDAGITGGYTTPAATGNPKKKPRPAGFRDTVNEIADRAGDQRAKGRSYKDFVKSRGGTSNANLAAVWSHANDKQLNAKMKASAAGRRIEKQKAKNPRSTTGNTQRAH